jgi:hypothetical protein
MVKFLIALAEMFSAFASKLHDMSENMDDTVVTRADIKDMINDALGDEIITADDVKGLDRFVEETIDERVNTSEINENHEFAVDLQRLILNYAFRNGMATSYISMYKEERLMKDYMSARYTEWHEKRKECETQRESIFMMKYHKANGGAIEIKNHDGRTDVKI